MLWSPWYEKHSFVYRVDLTCTHQYPPNQSKSRHRISMMWLERCYVCHWAPADSLLAWHGTLKWLAAWHWPSLSAKDVYELPIRRSSRVVTLSFLLCSPKYSTWHFSVQAASLAGNLEIIWTRCFGICLIGCDSNYKSKAQSPHKIWRLFLLLCPIDAVGKALFLAKFVHIFPVSRLSSNAPHVIGAAVFLPYFFVSLGYLTWHLAFWPYLLFCLIQVYDLFSSLHPYVKITSFVLEVDAGLAMLANHYVIWCARWECSYTFGLDI